MTDLAIWRSPDLKLANQLVDLLDPSLKHALSKGDLNNLAHCVGPDLWVVPVLSMTACERLTRVVDDRLRWQARHLNAEHSPNSMHYAGVILDPIGLAPAASLLRQRVAEPLRKTFFPEFRHLDEDYAFVATYGQQLDRRLDFHVDDSEVTLNISLSSAYSGGTLVFLGRRCVMHRQEKHRPEEEIHIHIPPGHGLIHAGSHRHLVQTVHGERRNLIIWCRSSETRRERKTEVCPSWCGHQGM